MTDDRSRRPSGLRRRPVEPLSPQAWHRVEAGVFSRLDASAVPWSLAPMPLGSYAAPRPERPVGLHWAASVGLALVSAAAAASTLHMLKPPPALEGTTPAELTLPAKPAPLPEPALPASERPVSTAPSEAGQLPTSSAAAGPSRPSAVGPLRAEPTARAPARRELHERVRSDRERLFERAASLESANAPLALALYLSLAGGEDAWAANALYAAARLEIDRGLRDTGAEHLAEYLVRFPAGENAVDVRGLRQSIGTNSD